MTLRRAHEWEQQGRFLPAASPVRLTAVAVIAMCIAACPQRDTGFPPAGLTPVREITSPQGDYRVVQFMSGEERQTWIVQSRSSAPPLRLPPAPLPGGDTTDTAGCLIDYFISPDGQWIIAVQKYIHNVSIAVLYRRVNGYMFIPAMERFDDEAWAFFARETGARPSDIPAIDAGPRIIAFDDWSPDSRRVAIKLTGGPAGREVTGWPCRFHTGNGRFERDQ